MIMIHYDRTPMHLVQHAVFHLEKGGLKVRRQQWRDMATLCAGRYFGTNFQTNERSTKTQTDKTNQLINWFSHGPFECNRNAGPLTQKKVRIAMSDFRNFRPGTCLALPGKVFCFRLVLLPRVRVKVHGMSYCVKNNRVTPCPNLEDPGCNC